MRFEAKHQVHKSSSGNALLITLIIVGLLAVLLTTVMTHSTQEQRMLYRAQNWNSALPLSEAGIEEAMSHLRHVGGGSRAVNGWQLINGNHTIERTLTHGRFVVAVPTSSALASPIIYATGYVNSATSANPVERRIRVTTRSEGPFVQGLVAKKKINLVGQFSSDSFDSSSPYYSTLGRYDPNLKKSNGDVGSNDDAGDAIDISGQVKIYGRASTGPGGNIKSGSKIAVGSASFIDSGKTGIEDGYFTSDMNVSFPDAVPFYTSGYVPMVGVADGTNTTYALIGGVNYHASTLAMSSGDKLVVSGNVTILVDKDFSLTGLSEVVIPVGSSLQVYVGDGTIKIAGNGVVNEPGNAASFGIWGGPKVNNVSLSGNGELVGTIYAPDATLSLNGGGNDIMDFIGAAVVKEVEGAGHFRFHYDEALGAKFVKTLYITTWREI
jgi:hypothetical protein